MWKGNKLSVLLGARMDYVMIQDFENTAIFFKQFTAILTLVLPPIVLILVLIIILKCYKRRRSKPTKEVKMD